jgi:hypothetical protein
VNEEVEMRRRNRGLLCVAAMAGLVLGVFPAGASQGDRGGRSGDEPGVAVTRSVDAVVFQADGPEGAGRGQGRLLLAGGTGVGNPGTTKGATGVGNPGTTKGR